MVHVCVTSCNFACILTCIHGAYIRPPLPSVLARNLQTVETVSGRHVLCKLSCVTNIMVTHLWYYAIIHIMTNIFCVFGESWSSCWPKGCADDLATWNSKGNKIQGFSMDWYWTIFLIGVNNSFTWNSTTLVPSLLMQNQQTMISRWAWHDFII